MPKTFDFLQSDSKKKTYFQPLPQQVSEIE